MRRKPSGHSLLEALVSLALVSVLLGVVASLMRDTSILMRRATDDGLAALQTALALISSDLRSAYQINQCDGLALEIVRIDPWDTARLPNPLPTPEEPFKMHGSDASIQVRYYQSGTSLKCKTTYSDGAFDDLEAVSDVLGFSASRVNPGLIELTVSTQDKNSNPVRVITLTTLVLLHLPPTVMP